MKIQMLGATKFVPKPTTGAGVTRMFSLWDNELIDDLAERFGFLTASAATVYPNQVTGQKMTKGVKTLQGMRMIDSYQIPANKPFCIQAKINITDSPDAYQVGILGTWSETDATQCGWSLWVYADGSVKFHICPDGNSANLKAVATPVGVVTFGTDYHIAVERNAANLITIYVNGVAKATGTLADGSFPVTTRLTVRRGWLGKVWDMSLHDNVVYGRAFTVPAKYTQLKNTAKYTAAIASDIVVQLPFRRDDPHCEVTGRPLQMAGYTQVAQGSVTSNTNATDTYNIPIDSFGAGDFTYECKFNVGSTPPATGVILPSHWYNGAYNNADNRFVVYISNSGYINFVISNGSGVIGSTAGTSAAGLIVPGKDYHFVAERIGSTVKMYLNSVLVQTFTFAGPLWFTTGNRLFGSYYTQTTCPITWWDLRIAKRALYNGNVVKPLTFPKMPVDYRTKLAIPNFTMRVGSIGAVASYGEVRGFAKNFMYGGQTVSCGELFPQVFWNTTQSRMMKIKAILAQGAQYLVLAMEPTNQARDANTPSMTNTLVLNGVSYSLVGTTKPSNGNVNETACYYTTAAPAAFFSVDEALKTFSFA